MVRVVKFVTAYYESGIEIADNTPTRLLPASRALNERSASDACPFPTSGAQWRYT